MPEVKLTASYDGASLDKGLNNLQKELVETSKAAQKLDSTLAKEVPKGANQAANALQNLGRIAQDAPFGFIGISNNINPLLESFQRLKVETGSTKAALSSLASGLIGGGGIGLAISVVTGLLTVLTQNGFFSATKAADEHKKSVERIGSTYDAFLNEIEKVSAALATESSKVQILTLALGDANTSALQRKNIIDQLNEISPQYLGNLDKEKSSYEDISKAVFDYTNSLAKSVEIKALLPEFEKLIQKIIKTQIELNQLRRIGTDQDNFFGLPLDEFKAEERRLENIIKATLNEVRVAKMALTDIAGSGLSLNEILFGKEINKKPTVKVKKADVEIQKLDKVNFGKQAIERIPPQALSQTITIPVIPRVEVKPVDQKAYEKALRASLINEGLYEIFNDLKTTVFRGLSDAFTQGLSGLDANSIFGNFFKSIFTTLGTALQELGLQTLAAGKLIMSVQDLLGTSAGLGASIGLIALGGILKALANSIKTPAFALGGIAPGGGILVGERGPEIITPPRGSRITPNAQTNAILGNGGWNGSVEFEIDGMKLRGLLQRADSRASRFGQ